MLKRLLLPAAFTATLLATSAATSAFAQPIFQPEDADPAALPAWPMTVPTNEILVVTLAEPGKRHTCRLGSLTAEAVTCVGSHGGKPKVYKAEEVEALINPRFRSYSWLWAMLPLSVGGAIMYGAVLLNPITEAAAVTVGIIAAVVILSSIGVAASSDADEPDRLLYLAPDHKLSVALRK